MLLGSLSPHHLQRIVDESTQKLLQAKNPSVTYWALVDIYKKELSDPSVRQTVRDLETYPPRVRLLERLREDGTWPISKQRQMSEDSGPGPPFGWTYITMLRRLQELGDYYAKRTDGHIAASLERILGWQDEEGFIPGPHSKAFQSPYYNSFSLRNLLQYEMERDPRVQKLAGWLLGRQRPDGGWIIPLIQDLRYRPPYKSMKMRDFVSLIESDEGPAYDPKEYEDIPSCIWSTMMAVRALTWSRDLMSTDAIKKGAEFFLDRFFQRNYHPSYYQSERNWTTLKYPTYYGSGVIALDILTYMGYGLRDPRMEKAIEWLVSARSRDALWHISDRPNPNKDLMVSAVAVTALNRIIESE